MTTISAVSINISTSTSNNNPIHRARCYFRPNLPQLINGYCMRCTNFGVFHQSWSKVRLRTGECGILWGGARLRREKRVVLVRFDLGFGSNGGDGGGGGRRDDGTTARVLGNLALAVGLTYLSITGQLGWVLDAIVSLWLLAVIVPIVGLGAFLWWAGRDMIQGTCPNCGNTFQVFKSSLNDELQLCPFCTQPFSVDGNEFVKEPITFSNRSTGFGQAFDDFSPWSRNGKDTSTAIVDVEAEIKDVD